MVSAACCPSYSAAAAGAGGAGAAPTATCLKTHSNNTAVGQWSVQRAGPVIVLPQQVLVALVQLPLPFA
jgi:hypothetical protein